MNQEADFTGRQTRRLLLIGFGGLLLLLAFSGFNTLSVLNRIQAREESIRLEYVDRDRVLDELRSDIYLSGTYVRDFLLDPDPERADSHRADFKAARERIKQTIAVYQSLLRNEESSSFEQFKQEVDGYFQSLEPALQWSASQRKQLGYAFMQESLLPRRMVIVRLTDQISRLNAEQMNSGNERLAEFFSDFRTDLVLLTTATLVCGLLLAGGSIYRILRLEHLSALRFREVQQARKALQELSARLVEVQEMERRALSRELHDEVGQGLSALLLALGNSAAMLSAEENADVREQLLDTRRLAERTVAVVRDMCLELRPSMLDDLGLVPALEWQAREISRTANLHVSVQADHWLEQLPDEQKTCIYRVVQEALRNVMRHAKAKHVQIRLNEKEGQLCLSIQDDGQGFVPERGKGLGILGMEERVRNLKGSFQIHSKPGGGTTIDVCLPESE